MSKKFGASISASNAITIIGAPEDDVGILESVGSVALLETVRENIAAPNITINASAKNADDLNIENGAILSWGTQITFVIDVSAPVNLTGLEIPWEVNDVTYLDEANTNTLSGTATVADLGGGVTQASVTMQIVANPRQDIPAAPFIFTIYPGSSSEQTLSFTRELGRQALFQFTSHTFTTANGDNINGPTEANVKSAYSSEVWVDDYISVTKRGHQDWTVPEAGSYRIRAVGGSGGGDTGSYPGGAGADMAGTFELEEGTILRIAVGHQGVWGGHSQNAGQRVGSGGGGSFVVLGTGTTNDDILVIAGGGGGAANNSWTRRAGIAASTSTAGVHGQGNSGRGTNGNGGSGGTSHGGAGAGFLSNPSTTPSGTGTSQKAQGYNSTLVGGRNARSWGGPENYGAFGGGGGGGGLAAGGGGGYSGGGEGSWSSQQAGGGGGSYNNGADQANSIYSGSRGPGFVEIEKL